MAKLKLDSSEGLGMLWFELPGIVLSTQDMGQFLEALSSYLQRRHAVGGKPSIGRREVGHIRGLAGNAFSSSRGLEYRSSFNSQPCLPLSTGENLKLLSTRAL